MKRPANALSDTVLKDGREVTVTGRIVGDYALSSGLHALVIAVPADQLIEIGGAP